MRRRGRLFKAMKWAMTLLSVAVLALFVASGWWSMEVGSIAGEGGYGVVLAWGRCGFTKWVEFPFQFASPADHPEDGPYFAAKQIWHGWPKLRLHESLSLDGVFVSDDMLVFPMQWLLLAAMLPTALLWWLDRKQHPPGHCPHCGYDLTGNESGVCPECGRVVEPSRAGKGGRSASSAAK